MNVKDIICKYETAQKDIQIKLDFLKKIVNEEDQLWTAYERMDVGFFLNEGAINLFADSLQMVDDTERLKQYDLQDIRKIYECLVEYYPDNIQYHRDLIGFVYNVLDDEVATLALINKAAERIDVVQDYFQTITTEIEKSKL